MKMLSGLLLICACVATAASAQVDDGPAAPRPGFNRPIEAGSWGGIVRNGPGMNHARIATLREGERVSLLYNTGIVWNDYPWFLIRLGDGRLGFQWGGILCRLATPVEGVYQRCTR
jgi:hypothetical protein